MIPRYDLIVIGVGGFGSAAMWHAASRGLKTLGVERFSVAHDRGSSHGQTRIIRKAYFEHPDYVPLLLRAYDQWRQLEREEGRELMRLCGLMLAGPPQGTTLTGARTAAQIHGIRLLERSQNGDENWRNGFRIPDDFDAVYEPDAGYLHVESCVTASVSASLRHGGGVASDETVLGWESVGRAFRVRTEKQEYEAAALVITAGAWAGRILQSLQLPLEVMRKPLLWFPVRSSVYDVSAGASAFYFETPPGDFYGFPSLDGRTLKVAEHSGGEWVSDPDRVDRSLRPSDVAPVAEFLRKYLPDVEPTPVEHTVCMYTRSPDCHFIVDRHPQYPGVSFGAGFSGHGFKFTPVIGEALVDLATKGQTELPVGFLASDRKALASVVSSQERINSK